MQLSKTQRRVLEKAASRERGNICPITNVRVHAASEMAVIYALLRRGFITDDRTPYITDAGRAAIRD